MAFKVRVVLPSSSGKVTVEVDRPEDSKCIGYEFDPIPDPPQRYFIGFYTKGSSPNIKTDTYTSEVDHIEDEPLSTSFTGLVVVENAVIERDRRTVRNARNREQGRQ